jgi:dipeptidyl-peptidase-4
MGGRALVAVGDDTARGPMRPVPSIEDASAVAGSPDGHWIAHVRDGDMWLTPLSGDGEPRRVTHDAEDGVTNGLADYAAAEELDRFEGMWWSWDGRHLAFARVDDRAIPRWVIPHVEGPEPYEAHRYPFAGGPNARISLRVAAADESGFVDVAFPEDDEYLARVVPHPRGGWLVATLPRDQRKLRWSSLTTDGTLRRLWTEVGDPWINLDDDTWPLTGGRILRTTEASGFRHLELREPDGGARALTGGPWVVTRLVHVDEGRGLAYFMATRDGPTERHLYRVALDEAQAQPERLTHEPGWHDVAFSDDGSRWADIQSDLDRSPWVTVASARGSAADAVSGAGAAVQVVAPRITADELAARPPELISLVAADGTTPLEAALYRPAQPATDPPPCVVWVYGGPRAQYVRRSWEVTVHPLRQYLSRAGVAVLVVDNRGSFNRGIEFERLLRGSLGSAEVSDQAAAVRQLAELGEIDINRVGITGGSYGGFMTLRAMALCPEVFRVGVAVSPVTDWTGYDTAYTERYLGQPSDEPEAYRSSSALEVARRITGSLLLIHGAIDENVHLRHSLRLVDALQAAVRDVELVILPRDRHRTRSASGLATRDRRTVRHVLEGLGVPLPDELRPESDLAQAATGA